MTVMLERPTPIETPDGPPEFEALCRTLLSMDVPDGYRAEIIRGSIVVSPWSKAYYFQVMESVREQVRDCVPEGDTCGDAPFLFAFPGQQRAYGPDVYVAARKAFSTAKRYVDGEALTMAVELTSDSTYGTDWGDKATVYGASGVPVYLLLDMREESATVFWAPSEKGYSSRTTVPFGKTLRLPAPFDVELDTSGFGAPVGETREPQEAGQGQAEA
ncbi:Putative restriction endonuclease [Streptomyces sp. WMMB 714]|uniref:Uma2 family endonuclease n=1 Tax=Streptomyces sp. WMMB 714 TaxID=1286822 RepID=UPI0005F804EC|nr:Uma2 family endonuclease [Streptomyces sp. WMMB 714]SCK19100.1 Putative restriction endonuclease [Streptomyces sp. WMMB 714]